VKNDISSVMILEELVLATKLPHFAVGQRQDQEESLESHFVAMPVLEWNSEKSRVDVCAQEKTLWRCCCSVEVVRIEGGDVDEIV